MLELHDVHSGYGSRKVLNGISMIVTEREIVSIIGANGGGKTTLLSTISGLVPCWAGEIIFEKKEISSLTPYKVVSLGLAQVPAGREVFAPLTVYENLLLGSYAKYRQLGRHGREKQLDFVFTLFPILSERKGQISGTLSGGEQQMLAIGRALMSRPRMLLLDEPSLGVAPIVVENIAQVLQELNRDGTTILLVEQNAQIALSLAHRAYVLNLGRFLLEGKSSELYDNEMVKEIYLGGV